MTEREFQSDVWLELSSGIEPGSDDAVETHRETRWKLAEGIGSLLGVPWELAGGIRGLREFAGSLLGVRQELAEGDNELNRMVSGVH
ncbi:hypothetical protein GW17_00051781 [Ensete ventricosum]|nr:hypothetical protein GW17_00051781 [Ensete ventricosum]RZS19042.1 hypothetical protein BHM03_00051383 [Ensete ventricosum]